MPDRGHFSGKAGFIFAAAGSAIGLSNIWRFPYLTGQNGGAVFLFIYLICIFLFCFPVLVGEIAIGRAAGKNAFGSYKKLGGKRWAWLGLAGIISAIFILSYYNVVAGWALGYGLEMIFGDILHENDFSTFFKQFVKDPTQNIIFSFTFLALTAIAVYGGVQKGIERANKFLMPALLIILIGLIMYNLTLPHAMEGLRFYLVPDFNKITRQTLFEALKLSFFTLSLGIGGLITYGSYLKKKEDIVYASTVVTWADSVVAFLAGLMIFPLVFSAGKSPAEGPALVFIVMPEIFKGMGTVVGKLVGGSFFLLLCFAAISSCISLLEIPVAYFVDEKRMPRKKVVIGIAVVTFLLGIPTLLSMGANTFLTNLPFYHGKDFLSLIADITDVSLTLGGCFMCIFISTRWGMINLNEELASGNPGFSSSRSRTYINFTIRFVCAPLLGLLSVLIIIDKVSALFR